MKKKVIIGLLWAAFCLKAVYFVLVIGATLLQDLYRGLSYYGIEKLPFYIPIDSLIYSFLAMLLMLLSCLMITNSLNKEQKGIAMEIVGAVLFSGVFSLFAQILGVISVRMIANQGAWMMASRSIVSGFLVFLNPISVVGTSLFILAAGMSIAYKKSLK